MCPVKTSRMRSTRRRRFLAVKPVCNESFWTGSQTKVSNIQPTPIEYVLVQDVVFNWTSYRYEQHKPQETKRPTLGQAHFPTKAW